MDSKLFDLTAKHLENRTDLDHLEARGTLRLALEKSGLSPKSFTLKQLQVVFQKVMPQELELRGIRYIPSVCNSVMARVIRTADAAEPEPAETIDETFRRLGGAPKHTV
jgi:hypothetical protein